MISKCIQYQTLDIMVSFFFSAKFVSSYKIVTMDGIMFTSTLEEPFKENKILNVNCLDTAAKTAIPFSEVPCFSFNVIIGHCSLPDSLAKRVIVLFPDSENVKTKFREIKSPAVIEVKSSSVVKVTNFFKTSITM